MEPDQARDVLRQYLVSTPGPDVSREVRLANGNRLRDWIVSRLQAGESLEHYRVTWVQDSAQKVLDFCGTLAEAFNAAHGDDCASVQDLLDVLATARERLKAYGEE